MKTWAVLAGIAGVGFTTKRYFSNSFSTVAQAESGKKEFEIDFADSLKEGEMKGLKVGPKDEDKVLVVRYQGKLYCVGNSCPHFGAPLDTGVLFDDKVLCPWHGASFNITTGALESAPSLEGLPKYEI